jgi:phosphoribosylformylglycinamidine synthase
VFKIESHNHPSFIEPFQGAATGIGGILRDIFTMGARPIALLDSLRFGPMDAPKNRAVMEGVIAGISSYGNSIGVPTVGGEIYFNSCYTLNPLVNVFCLGIAEKDKIFYAKTGEAGNAVLYVGSKTGRDGIHGATMASAEFGKETEHKRPNVQVGDPFKEKLLLEACLEVMDRGLIVGIQDMGAAGLTCSSSEMPAKSGTGIAIDLDLVPQREKGMTPYEILLSESQERMLIVAKPENVSRVKDIFSKWDLDAVEIGRIIEGGRLKVKFHGQVVVDVPVAAVVDLCPMYQRPYVSPSKDVGELQTRDIQLPDDYNKVFMKLISSPTIANKEWAFQQYDHMVQTNTTVLPGADASVLRIKGSKKALAITLDGNSLYARLDPRRGGAIAVAEASRNLACTGARPVGATNCMNFGNPEKPEVMGQFKEVIEGVSEACRALEIPVTGGNVSFYNDTEGMSIYPTPVLGVVGLIEDIGNVVTPGFKKNGDTVVLMGENKEELGGSEYLKAVFGREEGLPPSIHLAAEKAVQGFCIDAAGEKLLESAHDLSEGGLAVCAAESAFLSAEKIGCTLDVEDDLRPDAVLFGESQSRVLITVKPENLRKVLKLAEKKGLKAATVGTTGGRNIRISHQGKEIMNVPVEKAFVAWMEAIPRYFKVTKESSCSLSREGEDAD